MDLQSGAGTNLKMSSDNLLYLKRTRRPIILGSAATGSNSVESLLLLANDDDHERGAQRERAKPTRRTTLEDGEVRQRQEVSIGGGRRSMTAAREFDCSLNNLLDSISGCSISDEYFEQTDSWERHRPAAMSDEYLRQTQIDQCFYDYHQDHLYRRGVDQHQPQMMPELVLDLPQQRPQLQGEPKQWSQQNLTLVPGVGPTPTTTTMSQQMLTVSQFYNHLVLVSLPHFPTNITTNKNMEQLHRHVHSHYQKHLKKYLSSFPAWFESKNLNLMLRQLTSSSGLNSIHTLKTKNNIDKHYFTWDLVKTWLETSTSSPPNKLLLVIDESMLDELKRNYALSSTEISFLKRNPDKVLLVLLNNVVELPSEFQQSTVILFEEIAASTFVNVYELDNNLDHNMRINLILKSNPTKARLIHDLLLLQTQFESPQQCYERIIMNPILFTLLVHVVTNSNLKVQPISTFINSISTHFKFPRKSISSLGKLILNKFVQQQKLEFTSSELSTVADVLKNVVFIKSNNNNKYLFLEDSFVDYLIYLYIKNTSDNVVKCELLNLIVNYKNYMFILQLLIESDPTMLTSTFKYLNFLPVETLLKYLHYSRQIEIPLALEQQRQRLKIQLQNEYLNNYLKFLLLTKDCKCLDIQLVQSDNTNYYLGQFNELVQVLIRNNSVETLKISCIIDDERADEFNMELFVTTLYALFKQRQLTTLELKLINLQENICYDPITSCIFNGVYLQKLVLDLALSPLQVFRVLSSCTVRHLCLKHCKLDDNCWSLLAQLHLDELELINCWQNDDDEDEDGNNCGTGTGTFSSSTTTGTINSSKRSQMQLVSQQSIRCLHEQEQGQGQRPAGTHLFFQSLVTNNSYATSTSTPTSFTTLTNLTLTKTMLTLCDIYCLASSLSNNNTLHTLQMEQMKLVDVLPILQLLDRNQSILNLVLNSCYVFLGDESVRLIIRSLAKNYGVRRLEIGGWTICIEEPQTMSMLRNYLSNSQLTNVNMSNTKFQVKLKSAPARPATPTSPTTSVTSSSSSSSRFFKFKSPLLSHFSNSSSGSTASLRLFRGTSLASLSKEPPSPSPGKTRQQQQQKKFLPSLETLNLSNASLQTQQHNSTNPMNCIEMVKYYFSMDKLHSLNLSVAVDLQKKPIKTKVKMNVSENQLPEEDLVQMLSKYSMLRKVDLTGWTIVGNSNSNNLNVGRKLCKCLAKSKLQEMSLSFSNGDDGSGRHLINAVLKHCPLIDCIQISLEHGIRSSSSSSDLSSLIDFKQCKSRNDSAAAVRVRLVNCTLRQLYSIVKNCDDFSDCDFYCLTEENCYELVL